MNSVEPARIALNRRAFVRRMKWTMLTLALAMLGATGVSFCRLLNVMVLGPIQLEAGVGAGFCYAADISSTLLYTSDRNRFSIGMGYDWWDYRPFPATFYFDFCLIYPFGVVVIAGIWFWRLDRPIPIGRCQACSYDLRGNLTDVCPECGCRANATTNDSERNR